MQYPNFYESIAEAQIRLRGTVVKYDDEPYFILAITDHVKDGKFRVYISPLVDERGKRPNWPDPDQFVAGSDDLGRYLDEWMEYQPNILLRKEADSPYFNKYRPFPLGMFAYGTAVYYLERQPNRTTFQGLTRGMIYETLVDCGGPTGNPKRPTKVDMFTQAFIDCIKGDYNSPAECLKVLLDVDNYDYEAAPFHRDFALVKGPCEMVFLGHKDDIIGVIPFNDFSQIKLGSKFRHCAELVDELDLFANVM